MANGMFIGELAKQLGLTTKTIRYYESLGLLSAAERTEAGYRTYTGDDLERLRFIQGAKALGLSLDEIREILSLWSHGTRPCSHVGQLLDDKLASLDRRIQELVRFRDELRAYKAKVDAMTPRADTPCLHIEGATSGLWQTAIPESGRLK